MKVLAQRSFLLIAILLLFFSLSFLTEKLILSQTVSESISIVELTVGESKIIEVKNIRRFLVLDPEIVFAKIISPDKLEVISKGRGQTSIHIWDEKGLWSIGIKSEIKQIRITQEIIKRKELEEKIPTFKLDYQFDYQVRERGFKVSELKQLERIDDHRFNLSGVTPYGNVDSLVWIEKRYVFSPNKKEVFLDERNLTFKLSEANLRSLRNFDLILGDNYLNLLSFTFPGYRFRGITYGTNEHLKHLMRDKLSQPLEFTLFWGKSQMGGATGVPVGSQRQLDSFYIGSRFDYQANENLRMFTVLVGRYGDYRVDRTDNTVSIGVAGKYKIWDFRMEIARDGPNYAYRISNRLNFSDRFKLNSEFEDTQPHFFATGGRPSGQGIFGTRLNIDLLPFDFFSLSAGINCYKNRLFFNPKDPKRYNLIYSLASQISLPGEVSLAVSYRDTDQRGLLSPYQEQNINIRLYRPFFFGQKFFIQSLSPFYICEVHQNKNLNFPDQSYKNKRQEFGVSLGLPLGLFVSSSYQHNSLEEPFEGLTSSPKQWRTSLNFSHPISKSFFFGAHASYVRVKDTESLLCPVPKQDTLEGGINLNFRPSLNSNFYLRFSITNYRPKSPQAKSYNEAKFYFGGQFKFDTGIGIAPTGSIRGRVFYDSNKNGIWDSGESGIVGAKVYLEKKTTITDTEGRYNFGRVKAKETVLVVDTSTLPSGSLYTTPSSKKIYIEHGLAQEVDFGITFRREIRGYVFCDVNENKTFDEPDFPLENIVLILQSGQTTKSLRDGSYTFENLELGPNELSLVLTKVPVGYIPLDQAKIKFELKEGEIKRIDLPFKAQRRVIGYVFKDLNDDGILQKDEELVAGVRVYLDSISTSTDKDGRYIFTDLKMGRYTLVLDKATLPKGFIPTKDPVPLELPPKPTTKSLNSPLSKNRN